MIQSRENFVREGRTDEQTDTDESDFKGSCRTEVERPIF